MKREFISYAEGDFIYIEYINGEREKLKQSSKESKYVLDHKSNTFKFTEEELNFIGKVLKEPNSEFEISPSYWYKKRTEYNRNKNKEIFRMELDKIRKKTKDLTPGELISISTLNVSGIYIIYNYAKDKYYVGQGEKVYKRAKMHFQNKGNTELYNDYSEGDKFKIDIISLVDTSFSSLNELEDIAIRAFEAHSKGYNKMPGNIMDKPIYKSDDYQEASELILSKIKNTQWFSTLTNKRKRIAYTRSFLREFSLPQDVHFIFTFHETIKQYQKLNKNIK